MNTNWSISLIRAYRIFRLLVLFTVIIGGLIVVNKIHSQYFPLFILMILPTITPFMADLILERQKPEFFYYFTASIFLFTGIYSIQMTEIGLIALSILMVEMLISLALSMKKKEEDLYLDDLPEEVDLNWQAPAPPVLSPKEVIRQRIWETDQEIRHYAAKLRPLREQLQKSQNYLKEVDQRLNYPHLSRTNRDTSLKLQQMLQTSIEHYGLMIRFYEAARLRYSREKRNLTEKMGNLEIIHFLNDSDRMQEIASVEQTALDMEFRQQLRQLEHELPEIDAKMDAKAELLSHDLEQELTATIERLRLLE